MPDAPPPVYDTHGNLVLPWYVSVAYDPTEDGVRVTWHQTAGPYNAEKRGDVLIDPCDIEDAVAASVRAIRILGARRLF